jgi:hypothetical protein
MLNKTLISLGGLALMTGAAFASPDEFEREDYYEKRGPMPYEVYDLNRDGVVSAKEHSTVRAQRQAARRAQGYPMRHAAAAPDFAQIDSDGNAAISRAEFDAWQARHLQQKQAAGGRDW